MGCTSPSCCLRLSSGCSEEGSQSLEQATWFAQSRAKLRGAAEVQEAVWGPVPWQELSLLPMKPLFPPVLLSRNAVLPGADVAVAAPGAVLREVLSNALFAAVSGKLF